MGNPKQIDLGGLDVIVDKLYTGATRPGQTGSEMTIEELSSLEGITAGTVTAEKAVVVDASKDIGDFGVVTADTFTGDLTGAASVTSSVAGVSFVATPRIVQQAINADGAINLTTFYTAVTSVGTTGQAFTLADGTVTGQLKKIKLIVDDGDATVTFNTNATIVFADVGDYALLIWDGSDWIPIELGNDADGATAPAYTPAS